MTQAVQSEPTSKHCGAINAEGELFCADCILQRKGRVFERYIMTAEELAHECCYVCGLALLESVRP